MAGLIIAPLPHKDLDLSRWKHPEAIRRAIFYDPSPVYERMAGHLNHFLRSQPGLLTDISFPRLHNLCACGCGVTIKSGKVRKYATPACADFCYKVHCVIVGYASKYIPLVIAYYGHVCVHCGRNQREAGGMQIDHMLPVKHGGGACWLNNLVPVCDDCHREKTCSDFGWTRRKKARQNES